MDGGREAAEGGDQRKWIVTISLLNKYRISGKVMLVKLRFILGATKNRALKGMNREEFKEYVSGSFQRQQKPIPTYWRTRDL